MRATESADPSFEAGRRLSLELYIHGIRRVELGCKLGIVEDLAGLFGELAMLGHPQLDEILSYYEVEVWTAEGDNIFGFQPSEP